MNLLCDRELHVSVSVGRREVKYKEIYYQWENRTWIWCILHGRFHVSSSTLSSAVKTPLLLASLIWVIFC